MPSDDLYKLFLAMYFDEELNAETLDLPNRIKDIHDYIKQASEDR